MKITFTYHATERINDRLTGLVTIAEVTAAINAARLFTGENYIDVKTFNHRIYLGNPTDPETPKGDKITAKVIVDGRGATVITTMLRKSTSQSARYDRS